MHRACVAARAHLEGGTAAVGAGAVEHGVGLLRQACAEALACCDHVVHARSLLALGSALVPVVTKSTVPALSETATSSMTIRSVR